MSKIVTADGEEATVTHGLWSSANEELMDKLNRYFNAEAYSPHGGSPESLDDHLATKAVEALGGEVTERVPLWYKYVPGRVY